jgi:choline dehydrogenase-like flavoprotein
MSPPYEVLVVGSGPAGVACCWALAEKGVRVILVDPGGRLGAVDPDRPDLARVRMGHPRKAAFLLGSELQALREAMHPSPKLRLGAPPSFVADYISALRITTENFTLAGTLAPGGLSNVWGSAASVFDATDLLGTPLTPDDLHPSYCAVAARIGISGSADDDMAAFHGRVALQPPIPVGGLAQLLLDRHRRKGAGAGGLKLGLARNAVLSLAHGDRQACERDGFCMWGCRRRSIYNAAHELAALNSFDNVGYAPGCLVELLAPTPDGFCVEGRSPGRGGGVVHRARRVVLAAGTVATSRLALALLGRLGERRRLLTNPGYTFALFVPGALGRASSAQQFAMAQLSYALPLSAGGYTAGLIYAAECLSPVDIAERMPTTLRGGIVAARALGPAMLIGLGYFDGQHSDNALTVAATADGHAVHIAGGFAPTFAGALAETRAGLRRAFSRLGAILVPGSYAALAPGGDSHYAGTLAMGDLLTADCELKDVPGVYVADGAALGRLPAKHLTLTVMANADRVGRHIATLCSGGGKVR